MARRKRTCVATKCAREREKGTLKSSHITSMSAQHVALASAGNSFTLSTKYYFIFCMFIVFCLFLLKLGVCAADAACLLKSVKIIKTLTILHFFCLSLRRLALRICDKATCSSTNPADRIDSGTT